MDRRRFISVSGSAAGAAALTGCGPSASNGGDAGAKTEMKPMRMHVGTQRGPTNAEMLQYFKRHGLNHICGYPPRPPADRGYWLDEEVVQTREICEKHGIELEVVALPFLSSSHIDREKRGAIMMADSPERDRDIEHIHKMIIACSKLTSQSRLSPSAMNSVRSPVIEPMSPVVSPKLAVSTAFASKLPTDLSSPSMPVASA